MTAPGGPAAPEQPGADRAAFLRWASRTPAAANLSLVVVTDGEGFLPVVYPVGALTDTGELQLFLDEAVSTICHELRAGPPARVTVTVETVDERVDIDSRTGEGLAVAVHQHVSASGEAWITGVTVVTDTQDE